MMEAWLRTDAAAEMLDTTPNNLSCFSSRLEHVCIREGQTKPRPEGRPFYNPRKTPLLWPESVIRKAAAIRQGKSIGVAKAIEAVAGKRPVRKWRQGGA